MNKVLKKFLVGFISLGMIIITGSGASFINSNNYENETNTEITNNSKDKEGISNIHTMVASAPDFTTGEGTEANPFLIENIDDFKKFNNHVISGGQYSIGSDEIYYVDGYYKLTNDLTINSTTYSDFISIGTKDLVEHHQAHYFAGVFDGNNKKITLDVTIGTVGNTDTREARNEFAFFSSCLGDEITHLDLDVKIVKKVLSLSYGSTRC